MIESAILILELQGKPSIRHVQAWRWAIDPEGGVPFRQAGVVTGDKADLPPRLHAFDITMSRPRASVQSSVAALFGPPRAMLHCAWEAFGMGAWSAIC